MRSAFHQSLHISLPARAGAGADTRVPAMHGISGGEKLGGMRDPVMQPLRDGPQQVPIAVDAMGGDHAPDEIVAGAVLAARDGISVLLTGRPGVLRPLLARNGALADIKIVPAEDSIAMHEGALASWRRPRSSIAVACQLVRRGLAAAVVSAGSTGGVGAPPRLRLRAPPRGLRAPAAGGRP